MNHKQSEIYISPEGRKALLNHKYSGSDASILSEKFQPFWNWCVEQLPMTMAPNLVTLYGFLGITSSFLLIILNFPYLEGEHPWVMIYTSIMLFVYQTLDSIDGKQARRTGSSSPLGELFDHGCDAIVTMYQAVTTCAALQLGTSYWSMLFCTSIYFASTSIMWEDYYTDVLRFDKYSSPTEALVAAILMYFFTGVFGPQIWTFTIFGFQFNHIAISIASIASIKAFYDSVRQVLSHAPRPSRGNYVGAFSSSVGFVVVIISYLIEFQFCDPKYTLLFCVTYCLVLSYLTTRLIVSRVANEIISPFYVILIPTVFIILNLYYQLLDHTFLLFFNTTWMIICYTHFIVVTIDEIKTTLGIRTFHITPKKQD